MPVVRREVVCKVLIDGQELPQIFAVHCQFSLQQAVAQATIICPELPSWLAGRYNDPVEIKAGTIPGNGLVTRFKGLKRNTHYELWPRAVTIDCVGELQKAAEYFNWEDPLDRTWGIKGRPAGSDDENIGDFGLYGGLLPQDLINPWTDPDGFATAGQIIHAVLAKAQIDVPPGNIGSTGRLYGNPFNQAFIWSAGTVVVASAQGGGGNVFGFRQQGESALAYIQRYNQIEAEWDGADSGGFYRIVESLGGNIYVAKVGGRSRDAVAIDPGSGKDMVFLEGQNILQATSERQYPVANRVLVVGADTGIGYSWHYEAHGSNAFMTEDSYHYDPNPPSSPMIDWATIEDATTATFGMDCQTVAEARILEVNRETVIVRLSTAEDWYIGPAQTHIVQAAVRPTDTNAGGTVDRLGTGENLWVQGVDFSLQQGNNGAPVLEQSIDYLGGGLPDEQTPPIPLV